MLSMDALSRDASADRIAGVETLKALAGAVGVPSFTVASLAERSGVARRAVDTVLRRYPFMFERLPPTSRTGMGRPPVQWRLRPDRIDEVAVRVGQLQAALGPDRELLGANPPEPDLAEASLLMAVDAVTTAPTDDPEVAGLLLRAARDSLAAAGFGPDGASGSTGHDLDLSRRARMIASVADLVDAWVGGDQTRIDEAQARAFSTVVEAAGNMLADQWLPLVQKVVEAPGTVLSAPVLVGQDDGSRASLVDLFPDLRVDDRDGQVPDGYLCMYDPRPTLVAVEPVTFVLFPDDEPELRGAFARSSARPPSCLVVSDQPGVLSTALGYGARLVLDRGLPATRTGIANVVNRLALGLDRG